MIINLTDWQDKGQKWREEIFNTFKETDDLPENHDERRVRAPERTQSRDHKGGETSGRGSRGEGKGKTNEREHGAQGSNAPNGPEEELLQGSGNEGDRGRSEKENNAYPRPSTRHAARARRGDTEVQSVYPGNQMPSNPRCSGERQSSLNFIIFAKSDFRTVSCLICA